MSEELPKERCELCRFWKARCGTKDGVCRRYPPQVFGDEDGLATTAYPEMLKGSWCGEFRPKEST